MRLAVFALLAATNLLSLIAHPGSRIPNPGSRIPHRASRIAHRDVIDRIMAVVAGQPITLSDVTAALQFGLIVPPPGTADPRAYVLDRLIERTLVLTDVERFQPPEPDPVEITIRVDELERRAGSPAAFDKALAVTGMSREQLRRYIRDDLRITTYLNQRFGPTDTPERQAAIKAWVSELRKRADVTVLRTSVHSLQFTVYGTASGRTVSRNCEPKTVNCSR